MKPKLIALLVVLSAVLGVGAGFLVKRLNDDTDPPSSSSQEQTPTESTTTPTSEPTTATPTPSPTTSPTTSPTKAEDEPSDDVPDLVARNREDRSGPSWSPADPIGPDGQPLELGILSPGAFGLVRVGDNIDKYVDAGYLVADLERESICDGNYWKWAGQLSDGLDVIASNNGVIGSLGMKRDGLETAEGISVGNSLQALRDTYGKQLSEPRANDYGQAAVFLPGNGDGWLGFGFEVAPGQLEPTSRVTFIEATKGNPPGMLRDGC